MGISNFNIKPYCYQNRDRNYQIILKRDKTQEELRYVLQSMLIEEGNFTKITKDKCIYVVG